MGYSSLNVVKNFVQSDGNKSGSINNIFSYLQQKAYRGPLKFGGYTICGQNVIDVIAIGMERNVLRANQFDPVILSLDFLALSNLNLNADFTDSSTKTNYFSANQPFNLWYTKSWALPGTMIKFSQLTSCNSYATSGKNLQYLGATSVGNNKWSPATYDYWNQEEKERSNYVNDSTNFNRGITEATFLFYTTSVINELQARLGYKVPDNTDPFSWTNWLVANNYGVAGPSDSYTRYYKIMYLTEFDFYMHAGAMANPSRYLDNYLAQSAEFNTMISQITNMNWFASNKSSSTMNYFNTNKLHKGQDMAAGQYIYSKDYKFKMHLTHKGKLCVYEFPITGDSLDTCKYLVMDTGAFTVASNNQIPCYLWAQADGNIVLYVNPNINRSNFTFDWNNPKAGTGTNNNTYFGMNDYIVFVSYGGAVVATNPGVRDKIGTDKVAYVDGSIGANLKITSDVNDIDCVHGWKYTGIDGSNWTGLDQIRDLASDGVNTPYCYKSPYVMYNDSDGSSYKFNNTDMQMVLWQIGTPDSAVDSIYNFVNSGFIATATSKGWTGNFSTSANKYIAINYCMKGNRWASNPTCTSLATSVPNDSNVTNENKRVVDYDMRSRVCRTAPTINTRQLCGYIQPNTGNDMIDSLIQQVSPTFAIMNAGFGSYGIPLGDVSAQVQNVIATWINSCSDAQLMFLLPYINNANTISAWKGAYAKKIGVSALPARSDITFNPFNLPYGIIYYKNIDGVVTPYPVSFDTQLLKNMAQSAIGNAYTFPVDSNVWKYIRAYLDYKFPFGKLPPMTKTDLTNSLLAADLAAFNNVRFPYTVENWKMYTDNATIGDVWVVRLIADSNILAFLRNDSRYSTGNLMNLSNTTIASACSARPDYCYPEYDTIVANPKASMTSSLFNFVCDKANSASTGPAYFSPINAAQVKKDCNNTFGLQTCAAPAARYKSAFGNRKVIKGSSNYNSRVELFSGTDCVSICNDPNINQTLKDACRDGAVAYCKQSDNIFGDSCATDMDKYPELADIKTNWCANSANDPTFSKHCAAPVVEPAPATTPPATETTTTTTTPPTAQTTTTTTSVLDNGPTQIPSDTIDTSAFPWWGYLLIVIAIIIFGGLIGFIWSKRSKNAKQTSAYTPAATDYSSSYPQSAPAYNYGSIPMASYSSAPMNSYSSAPVAPMASYSSIPVTNYSSAPIAPSVPIAPTPAPVVAPISIPIIQAPVVAPAVAPAPVSK